MNLSDLDILRCPFCGGRLTVEPVDKSRSPEGELTAAVLGCACCAYPVVAGIPYLRTGAVAREALKWLKERRADRALSALLGVDPARGERFEGLLRSGAGFTYRESLQVLSPNPEGQYFLYRFSDPTFLISDALLRVVANRPGAVPGRCLDLCGGSGHLTRTLSGLKTGEVWLADLEFWKLWLARQFVAPECHAVCCDAAQPLPFTPGCFSLVVCADALHYIWPRRLLVGEMTRLGGRTGVVVATGLHNALCDNPSAGMALEPAAWRNLFEGPPVRLYRESALLDALLSRRPLGLSNGCPDAELASEPALVAMATAGDARFLDDSPWETKPVLERPRINPLYGQAEGDSTHVWTLRFPSPEYEAEFGACRRYLPERIELTQAQVHALNRGGDQEALHELARRRVVLDLPQNYI